MPRKKHVSLPSDSPVGGQIEPVRLPSKQGLGAMAYSDRELEPQFSQPIDKKQHLGRNNWANTAIVLSMRALKAAQTYGKKDFNALYRLILSAGIAYDKAWPTTVQPVGGNLVVQLFGSLGEGVAKQILQPPTPVIDVDYVEDKPLPTSPEVSTPKDEPVGETT